MHAVSSAALATLLIASYPALSAPVPAGESLHGIRDALLSAVRQPESDVDKRLHFDAGDIAGKVGPEATKIVTELGINGALTGLENHFQNQNSGQNSQGSQKRALDDDFWLTEGLKDALKDAGVARKISFGEIGKSALSGAGSGALDNVFQEIFGGNNGNQNSQRRSVDSDNKHSLYDFEGFVSPYRSKRTDLTWEDIENLVKPHLAMGPGIQLNRRRFHFDKEAGKEAGKSALSGAASGAFDNILNGGVEGLFGGGGSGNQTKRDERLVRANRHPRPKPHRTRPDNSNGGDNDDNNFGALNANLTSFLNSTGILNATDTFLNNLESDIKSHLRRFEAMTINDLD